MIKVTRHRTARPMLAVLLAGAAAPALAQETMSEPTAAAVAVEPIDVTEIVVTAQKRAYVHESIYDAMCDELARLAEAAVVDDGLAQGAQIGPIQNKAQYEKVKAFLESALPQEGGGGASISEDQALASG